MSRSQTVVGVRKNGTEFHVTITSTPLMTTNGMQVVVATVPAGGSA